MSPEKLELILELSGGGRLEDISWIIFYIWLWKLQNNHVQGFQPIKPPHHTLTGGQHRPHSYDGSSSSPSIGQTQLQMARTRRRRSVRIINMDEKYQKFLRIKHSDTVCSRERYEQLCTDPQRDIIDGASIKEAIIILEAEGRGIVQNVRRPTKDEPNLDFKDNGPGPIEFVDVKEPRNWGKGNEDLESAAIRMGEKIKKQKDKAGNFGIPREKVLHIVNFELLNFDERPDYQTKYLYRQWFRRYRNHGHS